ncbi:hypothetical protein AJ79_04837 [Helicocarpus griseus UAMH5409]|uniref:Aminoglycoside phosphotransferase domain-containing protein n=1 Tax=Helicocarpus griseus UAMH5409 TaxID=1447875 RepID=A0A2B7XS56_9EURO|nr:hypothetical protein AJ79_04837 [Helicocarpus griseus UAMH5409]
MGKILRKWIGGVFNDGALRCTDEPEYPKPRPRLFTVPCSSKARLWVLRPSSRSACRIPSTEGAIPSHYATDVPSSTTLREIRNLEYFNEKGCSVTPRLLHKEKFLQGPSWTMPGGYIVFIVMEKVPGVPLTDFWTYDRPKRDRIREAFRKSLTELRSFGGYSIDMSLPNFVYDEEGDKCYFVDYEGFFIDMGQAKFGVDEEDYHLWGLATRRAGVKYEGEHIL